MAEMAGGSTRRPGGTPWYLLALRRAEQLEDAIHDRRQYVAKQLEIADRMPHRPSQQGDRDRRSCSNEYGGYTDLRSYPPAPARVPPATIATAVPPRQPRHVPATPRASLAQTRPHRLLDGEPAGGETAPATRPDPSGRNPRQATRGTGPDKTVRFSVLHSEVDQHSRSEFRS